MSVTHFNSIMLIGCVSQPPVLSHESHGEPIYRMMLAVARLSGSEDEVLLHIRRSLLEGLWPAVGQTVMAEGEIRSFNNKTGVGARLIVSVFVKSLSPASPPHANEVMLSGAVCRLPVYRHTPLGREICDVMLAVNRRYRKSDYIPCIAWGLNARACADLPVGSPFSFEGRLQSRRYIKETPDGPITKTAYEVSVVTMLETVY